MGSSPFGCTKPRIRAYFAPFIHFAGFGHLLLGKHGALRAANAFYVYSRTELRFEPCRIKTRYRYSTGIYRFFIGISAVRASIIKTVFIIIF